MDDVASELEIAVEPRLVVQLVDRLDRVEHFVAAALLRNGTSVQGEEDESGKGK